MNIGRYDWGNFSRYFRPAFLGMVSTAIIGGYWYKAASGSEFSVLESFLWQLFGLVGGVVSSAWLSREMNRGVEKKHARSAFRRLLSLTEQIYKAVNLIEFAQTAKTIDEHKIMLARLEETVDSQRAMVNDALEDWNDIVPEEIEKIKVEVQNRKAMENRQWQN